MNKIFQILDKKVFSSLFFSFIFSMTVRHLSLRGYSAIKCKRDYDNVSMGSTVTPYNASILPPIHWKREKFCSFISFAWSFDQPKIRKKLRVPQRIRKKVLFPV